MKSSSAKDYRIGDRVITHDGLVGNVKDIIGDRYVEVEFDDLNIDKKIYVPSHGDIELV